MMTEISRRTFTRGTLGSLLTFSLLETLFQGDAFAAQIKPVTAEWLAQVNTLTREMRGRKLKQVQWQSQVEALLGKIDLPELLKFVDFEKLTNNFRFRDQGERAVRPNFPQVEGLPTNLVYGHQIFGMRKDQSVVPHGHNNMATAFVVLRGAFHGRHYDRLEDDAAHMIIKPTIDRPFAAGEFSTVSDFKDNVHWFKATSEDGFLFNIHVLNVDPQVKKRGRVYVDPAGEKLSGGRIRARILKTLEAYKLYG